ncbi:MAG: heme o synthase [Bacteroidota bacterium]|nr:heme o synthase [Bacteroidota bacterium]MDW8137722.1 heme o synthase [Bacteroidota bacterium]
MRLWHYLELSKPTITLLVLLTAATALVAEGEVVRRPVDFGMILLAIFLTSASANALNQYFERERDAQMRRTAQRRPLPRGLLKPKEALLFAVAAGLLGVGLLAVRFNLLSAFLALLTIGFYSFFYTLWLKPRTAQNIVIGGAAGAMGPVIAWAAATGGLELTPWILFLVIFFWTPPHFWALALMVKQDYERVRLPMMPVVKGDPYTLRQILLYTVVTFLASLALLAVKAGLIYLIFAVGLGLWFLYRAYDSYRRRTVESYRKLFGASILYLLALFVGVMVDAVFRVQWTR